VPAILGVARVAAEENPPAAKQAIERALKINPNSVPAHLLAAEMALDDRKRDDARDSAQRALKVNPNSLEARSLVAAIDFLEGKTTAFDSQVQQILKINPVYGEVYRVAGDHLARNYRFDEAVEQVRRALALDDANTRRMRISASTCCGPVMSPAPAVPSSAPSRTTASISRRTTRFSCSTTLDKFETITDGDLIFRFDPSEAAVMREHAIPLAKEAMATLSKRYNFTPTGPILIEMFPKHDDFAVRTIGLPGMIGALGACFGRVVTLDSPKARPPGGLQLGRDAVARVGARFTIQMSKQRVPRWLTEGTRCGKKGARVPSGAARWTSPSRTPSTRARS
jgi:tetratricopeptide (TPR) repeat protein